MTGIFTEQMITTIFNISYIVSQALRKMIHVIHGLSFRGNSNPLMSGLLTTTDYVTSSSTESDIKKIVCCVFKADEGVFAFV